MKRSGGFLGESWKKRFVDPLVCKATHKLTSFTPSYKLHDLGCSPPLLFLFLYVNAGSDVQLLCSAGRPFAVLSRKHSTNPTYSTKSTSLLILPIQIALRERVTDVTC